MSRHILAYLTAGNKNEARRLAAMLLEKRLVACINIHGPVSSLYRWKKKIQASAEYVLIAKTRTSLMPAMTAAVKKAHSYECPCIIALPIVSGYTPFLRWIDNETRSAAPKKKRKGG